MTGIEILTAASIAATAGSTVMGIGQQKAQAKAEQEQSKYNEAVARRETALAIQKEHRDQYLRAGRQLSQGAAQGAGTSGSLLDIMADTAYQSELSILGMRESLMLTQTAEASRRSNIKKSSTSATYGSLLSGASDIAKTGYNYYTNKDL